MQIDPDKMQYAGFWDRLLAFVLDNIMLALLLLPLLFYIFGAELLVNLGLLHTPLGLAIQYGGPLLYIVLFWKFKSATPGKMLLDMVIVDADTWGKPSTGRLLVRYLGYYLCVFTGLLGFIWIAFDKRKQGLHDKLGNTVVLMKTPQKS